MPRDETRIAEILQLDALSLAPMYLQRSAHPELPTWSDEDLRSIRESALVSAAGGRAEAHAIAYEPKPGSGSELPECERMATEIAKKMEETLQKLAAGEEKIPTKLDLLEYLERYHGHDIVMMGTVGPKNPRGVTYAEAIMQAVDQRAVEIAEGPLAATGAKALREISGNAKSQTRGVER